MPDTPYRLEAVEHAVRAFGPVATQVAQHEVKIGDLQGDMEKAERLVERTKNEILGEFRELRKDIVKDQERRGEMSSAMKVAVITGCFTVMASLVLAISAVLGAHP